jgi:hypothetical protein
MHIKKRAFEEIWMGNARMSLDKSMSIGGHGQWFQVAVDSFFTQFGETSPVRKEKEDHGNPNQKREGVNAVA